VVQKGSLVAPERLRFDFAHFEAVKDFELLAVEDEVNRLVLENHAAQVAQMSFDAARERGAMALFGEKYGDEVRVVQFGPSVELCGGIHVHRTGDIGLFKITGEQALSAGIRRMEAVTGLGALEWVRRQSGLLHEAASSLSVREQDLPARVLALKEQLRESERELERFRQKASAAAAGAAAKAAREINGVKVLTEKLLEVEAKGLRDYADKLRDQLKSGVVALGVDTGDNKVALLVAITPDLVGRFHAGNMIKRMAEVVGGRGGGKADLAQAGGQDAAKLDEALSLVDELVGDAAA
ncbi:MAG: DHHA1 domain-containing protein, partial [Myxococcota bacterium]